MKGSRGNENNQVLVLQELPGNSRPAGFWPVESFRKPCTRKLEVSGSAASYFLVACAFPVESAEAPGKPICGFTRRPSLPPGIHSSENCTCRWYGFSPAR